MNGESEVVEVALEALTTELTVELVVTGLAVTVPGERLRTGVNLARRRGDATDRCDRDRGSGDGLAQFRHDGFSCLLLDEHFVDLAGAAVIPAPR